MYPNTMNQDSLEDILIYSDEEYNPPLREDQCSPSSSQQLQALNGDVNQQLYVVEAKYQKYKKLRKKLKVKLGGFQDNIDKQESLSSFSGSSLSNSQTEEEKTQKGRNSDGISNETLQIIASKFIILEQQKQTNPTQQTLTIDSIALSHGVNPDYLQYLFSLWKKDSTIGGRVQKANQSSSNNSSGKVRLVPTEEQFNKARISRIQELKMMNPSINANEILMELNKSNELKENKMGKYKDISITLVYKLLKELAYSQKIRILHPDRNSEKIVELRYFFCKQVLKKVEQKAIILFLDEHNFKLFQAGRDGLWLKPPTEVRSDENQDQFSLLTCFDMRGGAYFKISKLCRQKYDDQEGFYSLVKQALEEQDQKQKMTSTTFHQLNQNQRQLVLIMDNSILHNQAKIKKYKQRTKGKILLLPQFSPQLNPIEEWFLRLRERIRKDAYANSFQLCQGVHNILKQQQAFNYEPIINGAMEQIRRGFKRGRF